MALYIMPQIIDAFMFYNELNMLDFRLTELYEHVDKFVIVEATKTFSGKPKELYYELNKNRYQKYADKILYFVTDLPDSNNAWHRESAQRNAIRTALKQINPAETDIIVFSDLDEIPDTKILDHIRKNGISTAYNLKQEMYYYHLNCKAKTPWVRSQIMPFALFKRASPQEHRNKMYQLIYNGGWHFSYFGDSKFISNKIQNFSHQEYNNEKFTNEKSIQEKLKSCTDLFDRDNSNQGHQFYYQAIENNNYLPKNYKMLPTLEKLW